MHYVEQDKNRSSDPFTFDTKNVPTIQGFVPIFDRGNT